MSAASSSSLSATFVSRPTTPETVVRPPSVTHSHQSNDVVVQIPVGSPAWERFLRAVPGGSLQGDVNVLLHRDGVHFWSRFKPVPSSPAGLPEPTASGNLPVGFQTLLAMRDRSEDAPPPIDLDVDDLCYAIFGIDPDGDQVSTKVVSGAALKSILAVSGTVIYAAGTVPAALQMRASWNRLGRLAPERRELTAARNAAQQAYDATASGDNARHLHAVTALAQRARREVFTERSRLTFAGCSAAAGTLLAGTSAFLKLAPHTSSDGDKTTHDAVDTRALARRDNGDGDGDAVKTASTWLGAVGVGLIGAYGVGTAVQCAVASIQHARQKSPTADNAVSPWHASDADVFALIEQTRVRRRNHAAISSVSYLGLGIGVPMTNWAFMRNVPAGLTLLLCGAAGVMGTKLYTHQVLQYHKLVSLLERTRLNTLPKLLREIGFVEQERQLLANLERHTRRGWGWTRADDDTTLANAFNVFLVARLQLEEQYWPAKQAQDPQDMTASLTRCQQALADAQAYDPNEAPEHTARRLLAFFDNNGLLPYLCRRIVSDSAARTRMGVGATDKDVTFSAAAMLAHLQEQPRAQQEAIRRALVRTAVTFLRGDYRHWRLGRRNELCEMALDLHGTPQPIHNIPIVNA